MLKFVELNPEVAELIITAARVDNSHVRASLIESNGIDIKDPDLDEFLKENHITISYKSTAQEEDLDDDLQLIMQYKSGNRKAYEAISEKYTPIIERVANKFFDSIDDFEEACQESQIVLKTALDKYDPSEQHVSFRYYAIRSLQNGLYEFKRLSNSIVLPENVVRECNKILKTASRCGIYFNDKKTVTDETIERLADLTGLKAARVREVMNYLPYLNSAAACASLTETQTDEGMKNYAEVLTDKHNTDCCSVEERFIHDDVMRIIHEAITKVTEDDQEGYEVICEFYGLDGFEKKKRKDIAEERGKTVYELDLIRTDVEEKIGLELVRQGFSYNFNENIDTFCA